jgi:hypothetical protein
MVDISGGLLSFTSQGDTGRGRYLRLYRRQASLQL